MFELFKFNLPHNKKSLIKEYILMPIFESYRKVLLEHNKICDYEENHITEVIVKKLITDTSISKLYNKNTIEISYRPKEIRDNFINEPDIKITLLNCLRLEIEAKRIHNKDNWSEKEYLGKGGIERFLSGYYAPNQSYGSMLCYVQKGEFNKIIDKIIQGLEEKNCLFIDKTEKSIHLIYSTHSRHNLSKINLYHSFLNFK